MIHGNDESTVGSAARGGAAGRRGGHRTFCAGGLGRQQGRPVASQGGAPQNPPGQKGPGQGQQQPDQQGKQGEGPGQGYTIEQAASWKAQLSTYAFSGLAFLTGTYGADTFMPPGKVADYFGFQYMRDIDAAEAGHNTMFLTNICNNVLAILDDDQKALMVSLAADQVPLYTQVADKRLVLIKAFRQNMEGTFPPGTSQLSQAAVSSFVGDIFAIDGTLSLDRAAMYGKIAASLTSAQKAALAKLKFGDSSTWPSLPDQYDKRTMTHEQDVLFMTYASEFFSWYAGSETADVYFCPERHATYFGGFYMKDYPAMGNNDYFIPTALTGDSGEGFLAVLTDAQAKQITGLEDTVSSIVTEIIETRTKISRQLRADLSGGAADSAAVLALSRRYGELDGRLSYFLDQAFASIRKSLTPAQKAAMVKLRNQDVFPPGVYRYSDPIPTPAGLDASVLFTK